MQRCKKSTFFLNLTDFVAYAPLFIITIIRFLYRDSTRVDSTRQHSRGPNHHDAGPSRAVPRSRTAATDKRSRSSNNILTAAAAKRTRNRSTPRNLSLTSALRLAQYAGRRSLSRRRRRMMRTLKPCTSARSESSRFCKARTVLARRKTATAELVSATASKTTRFRYRARAGAPKIRPDSEDEAPVDLPEAAAAFAAPDNDCCSLCFWILVRYRAPGRSTKRRDAMTSRSRPRPSRGG